MITHPEIDSDLAVLRPELIVKPVMEHRWLSLSFIHWPFEPAEVQRMLPRRLEVDTFGGAAWIGLVPFKLEVRLPPSVPAVPHLSTTLEVNARTYVRGPDGRRGIWFFSLDASSLTTVLTARAWYRIPYMWARMRFDERKGLVTYECYRRGSAGARFKVKLAIGAEIGQEALTPLEQFLMFRWRLYSPGLGLAATQIEHPPWSLRRAEAIELDQSLVESLGLASPMSPPLLHFSPGVRVQFGRRIPV